HVTQVYPASGKPSSRRPGLSASGGRSQGAHRFRPHNRRERGRSKGKNRSKSQKSADREVEEQRWSSAAISSLPTAESSPSHARRSLRAVLWMRRVFSGRSSSALHAAPTASSPRSTPV